MAELTVQELADFRADIGDTSGVFTDAELQRLYARASEDYDTAILYAIDQLIANASKFADYTQNQSQEKKSQIFDHLLRLRSIWKSKVDAAAAAESAATQVRIVGLSHVPPRRKNKPGEWGCD